MKIWLIGLSLISVGFTLCSAQVDDTFVKQLLKKYQIPQLNYAVVTADTVVQMAAFGHHKITQVNVESKASIHDLMHIGSNTKSITAFLAAILVEAKLIRWDTRFFELFPKLKAKSKNDYHKLTLIDLLSHRTNLPTYTSGAEYANLPPFDGKKDVARARFVEYVLSQEPLQVDAPYNYSNAGYSLAALMMEEVSGKSWEELVQDVMFNQLSLKVAFGWPNRNEENQPFGHWVEGENLIAVDASTDYDLSFSEPAGDLSMSIKDYATYIQLHLIGLGGEDNLLKADTYQYIHTARDHYALGWGNPIIKGQAISEHAGSDGTFYSYTFIDRTRLKAIIIQSNVATPLAQQGIFKLVAQIKDSF